MSELKEGTIIRSLVDYVKGHLARVTEVGIEGLGPGSVRAVYLAYEPEAEIVGLWLESEYEIVEED